MIPLGTLGAAHPRSTAVGPWTPAALGVQQWLNDESPVFDAGGGACSLWEDISGLGRHFEQAATASKRPLIDPTGLNGRRIVTFDGGDIMSSDDARGIFRNVPAGYLFGLYRLGVTDASPTQRAFYWFSRGGGAGTSSRLTLGAANSSGVANAPYFGGRRLDGDAFAGAASSTPRAVQWVMALGVCDYVGRRADLYVNGVLDSSGTGLWGSGGNTADTDSNGVTLGGILSEAAYFQGSIAEVFAGVGVPASEEIDKVFGYAAHRWGLAANLPPGHPYKDAPPEGGPPPAPAPATVESMWVGVPT